MARSPRKERPEGKCAEDRGFMVSSKQEDEVSKIVDTHGEETKPLGSLKYLGSILEKEGGCKEDINARVGSAWRKWRESSAVVCDKNKPTSP